MLDHCLRFCNSQLSHSLLYKRLHTLEESTGSMELRALTMTPSRLKVRFARDKMIPGSATWQRTSGPALSRTSRVTMPPSTTT